MICFEPNARSVGFFERNARSVGWIPNGVDPAFVGEIVLYDEHRLLLR